MISVNDVIGGVDNGWTVGKRLLQFERSTHAGINISGSQGGRQEESKMPGLVKQYVPLDGDKIADGNAEPARVRGRPYWGVGVGGRGWGRVGGGVDISRNQNKQQKMKNS